MVATHGQEGFLRATAAQARKPRICGPGRPAARPSGEAASMSFSGSGRPSGPTWTGCVAVVDHGGDLFEPQRAAAPCEDGLGCFRGVAPAPVRAAEGPADLSLAELLPPVQAAASDRLAGASQFDGAQSVVAGASCDHCRSVLAVQGVSVAVRYLVGRACACAVGTWSVPRRRMTAGAASAAKRPSATNTAPTAPSQAIPASPRELIAPPEHGPSTSSRSCRRPDSAPPTPTSVVGHRDHREQRPPGQQWQIAGGHQPVAGTVR